MSIIRIHKQKNFSIISNIALNDPKLSMKARGIWATLLSKPDDWTIYVSQLVKTCCDGKTSIYAGLKELKDAGYIEHVFIRENGKFAKGEYILHEEPVTIDKTDKRPVNTPYTENLNTVNPNTVNQQLLKTDLKLKTDDNKRKEQPPKQDPSPAPQTTEQPSSSLPSIQLTALISALFALIPEQYQQPALKATFRNVLKENTEIYIKQAIAYTIAHSTGQTKAKFKAYLGKCLDNGWADGYEPDTKQPDYQEKQARFLHSRRQMPISVLIQDSRNGCKTSQEVLTERGISWE